MAAIWARSREAIRARVAVLEELALALLAGNVTDALRADAEREAHRLAGSLGTFGLRGGSELARDIETRLATGRPFAPTEVAPLCEKILTLTRLVESYDPAATPAPVASDAAHGEVIAWFVGQTTPFVQRVENRLLGHGWRFVAFADTAGALGATDPPPHHLVLRWAPDAAASTARLLEEAQARHPDGRRIVLGDEADLEARIAAADAGATRFLPHDVEPDHLVEALLGPDPRQGRTGRILVVDDDPAFLTLVESGLTTHGHQVFTLAEPERFWETLRASRPDLVLMDLDMPRHDGVALFTALRTDPEWDHVPVVFLTAITDERLRGRADRAGAEEILEKPIDLERLAERVHQHLGHATGREEHALTGALNVQAGHRALERLAALAAREKRPFSLACAHLLPDRLMPPAREDLRGRILAALRRRMRPEDVVFADTGRVLVGAYGLDRDELGARLAAVVDTLGPDKVALGVGIAGLGADGGRAPELVTAADAAARHASAEPDTRLLYAGQAALQVDRPDVVIVEDDDAVAELLRHTLDASGYSVRCIDDGQSALRLLGGGSPPVRPRLILLDVNLPSLDGLSLLRRLRADGALQRTKVVMLTARSGEREVLKALELGATDHVAKPFSVPVLLQRIRRALGG